jgi:hypothetical protein
LLEVIAKNKASSRPICEFNYTDIGLALTSLTLAGYRSEAANWLLEIADFIAVNYSPGYEILPLGKDFRGVLDNILIKRDISQQSDDATSRFDKAK